MTAAPGANTGGEPQAPQSRPSAVQAPSVSLPRGGGAIRGIGETFAPNALTGSGSLSVPIRCTAGRAGFGPQLSLTYDSAAGNGPFGLGWSLSLPSISRKTDRGLPRYLDSDVFLLTGAEDLVPVLVQSGQTWLPEYLPPRTVGGVTYQVQRYRPRIEGLFARIERWTNQTDPTDVFWRSVSSDNITSWYGKTEESRITDPSDTGRIFSWLLCERSDDTGNAIRYDYTAENDDGVDGGQVNERNRLRSANRYVKRIRYGNHAPYLPQLRADAPWPAPPGDGQWYFELVFDYGEHDVGNPKPDDAGAWATRLDPFSSYRAGFEVRTYRRCRRALMFHHFADEPEVGADCLVQSTDFRYVDDPSLSYLRSITHTGYQRTGPSSYLARSLPPLELGYSQARVQPEVHNLDLESSQQLPTGIWGASQHWVDLDGEGTAGILIEQADAWFYKRNLSPLSLTRSHDGGVTFEARFGPLEPVATKPLPSLAQGAQLLDLAGDGRLDLVQFEGAAPGFFDRSVTGTWEPYTAFAALPNLDWSDPNLRFVDLNGDGLADVLITEDDALTWHASLGEAGFGAGERLPGLADEERGPRLLFADAEQCFYLADMSGDGLTDLVRLRNGEVCYWPNLGYGRFGAKVAMDDAPWFEAPEQFDQRRVRLGDIDGSGTTDIVYLVPDRVAIYRNLAGNRLSAAEYVAPVPRIDDLAAVQLLDLFGNGTACLVWSSPLRPEGHAPIRYVDLMGGQKPHLLTSVTNNLGGRTQIQYAPSTRFSLQDALAGTPWVTRLPFPVHCVEKVTVTDTWRKTTFTTTYAYHHGYFDGPEREFRGFGRVEQVDAESFGTFMGDNADSPYITADKILHQPPVKTVSWYHTGAMLDRERILAQFAHEYFPRWLPAEVQLLGGFQERALPEPDLAAENLSADDWREALRACKGMLLRQEVCQLDLDALEQGVERPVQLLSAAYHNCHIGLLQARGPNPHAVFLVTERETIDYHYELDLTPAQLRPDPRIVHTLNLRIDDYGHVLQSAAVQYPRLGQADDTALSAEQLAAIRTVQGEGHLLYSEHAYTDDVDTDDSQRVRAEYEALTHEITGISPTAADGYYRLAELQALLPDGAGVHKRLVEHDCTLFFDDAGAILETPLPLGKLGRLGLVFETYALALTDELLQTVFGARITPEVRAGLRDPSVSGYASGAALAARLTGRDVAGQYWIRSGVAGFEPTAAQHFYQPTRYTDAFGSVTSLQYDPRDLFVQSSTDALGGVTRVTRFDVRVMAPRELSDPNGNRSEVAFDALGLTIASALKGKAAEGDDLSAFDAALANPELAALAAFFTAPTYDEAPPRAWLQNATTRHVYSFGSQLNADGSISWGAHPACICSIARERHVGELAAGAQSPLQVSFEYTDGLGDVIVSKRQAEPETAGGPLRWVATGKRIVNNKNNVVKQYEPYFSPPAVGHRFEEPLEEGVATVIAYDAAGRVIRSDRPDGAYRRVTFSPWHVLTFDENDTLAEPGNPWLAQRLAPTAPPEERRAATLATEHANTPALAILDSLGREVIAVAHNRSRNDAGGEDDTYSMTFTRLDTQGRALWIRDARGNLARQYIVPPVANNQAADPPAGFTAAYDLTGTLLFEHSLDAGERWVLNDSGGAPFYGWNSRGFVFFHAYDALHRPAASYVTGSDPANPLATLQFEQVVYGETPGNGLSEDDRSLRNLRGQIVRHGDGAGIVSNDAFDFKGNLLRSSRQLCSDYTATPDWSAAPALEDETFTSSTRFDALNRAVQTVAPHSNRPGATLNVTQQTYNAAGLLERVDVWLEHAVEPAGLLDPATASHHMVTSVEYNAKRQRTRIEYAADAGRVVTEYTYDPQTFRLARLTTTRPNGADLARRVLQDLLYTYDPVGNITQIRDQAQDAIFHSGACVAPGAEYRYDALYRLTAAAGREHAANDQQPAADDTPWTVTGIPNDCQALRSYVEVYRYDAVGNLLQVRHHQGRDLDAPGVVVWNRRQQYALDSNRLLASRLPGDVDALPDYVAVPGYSARYAYDAHGNMVQTPQLTAMQWNMHDQLSVTRTAEATYCVYDPAGQRVRKVTERQNGQRKEERIYLDGVEDYRRYNGNGGVVTLERETLHVLDDRQRIALVETRTRATAADPAPRQLVRYQHVNHLGSTLLEVDDQAQVISYEEYHPFGTTAYLAARSQTETPKRYRYTGKERDEETGFAYHGARYYYAPWLARWTSPDPSPPHAADHAYAYGENNPVRCVDPDGHAGRDRVAELLADAQKTYRRVKTTVYAEAGDVAEYAKQGAARWADPVKRVARQTEAEHPVPGAAAKALNPAYVYRRAKTIVIDRAVAVAKTTGDMRMIKAVKSGAMDAKELATRAKANFVKAVATRWAQTGETSASRMLQQAKRVAEVTEESVREALPTVRRAAGASRAGQAGSADVGLMTGIASTGFAVVTGALSYRELKQDLQKKDYAAALSSGSGVLASATSVLARGAAAVTGVSSSSIALTAPVAGMGTGEAIAAAPHVAAALAMGTAVGVGIEHVFPEYTRHTADVGTRVEKASGSTLLGGVATVGTTLPLVWGLTKGYDWLTKD